MKTTQEKLRLVLDAVYLRAQNNLEKWGDVPRADTLWLMILTEEIGEVAKAMLEAKPEDFIDELLDVCAVAVGWVAERTGE